MVVEAEPWTRNRVYYTEHKNRRSTVRCLTGTRLYNMWPECVNLRTNPPKKCGMGMMNIQPESDPLGQYIWRTKCHSGTKYFVLETKFWPENLSSKKRPKYSSSNFEDEILRTDFSKTDFFEDEMLRTKCFDDKLLLRMT